MNSLELIVINLICLITFIVTVALIRHPACSEAPSPSEKKLTRLLMSGFCLIHGIRWLLFVVMPTMGAMIGSGSANNTGIVLCGASLITAFASLFVSVDMRLRGLLLCTIFVTVNIFGAKTRPHSFSIDPAPSAMINPSQVKQKL